MRNFYQLAKLYLKTSYFEGSDIETLWIENVNDFGGFESDTLLAANGNVTGTSSKVHNIVITKCYIKTLKPTSIGAFKGLHSVQITLSGLTEVEPESFSECCRGLRSLNLGSNLLAGLGSLSLAGLTSLQYLSLENNPLDWMEPGLFDSSRTTLKRLNLKSTQIKWLNGTYRGMSALSDLVLAETTHLDLDNLDVIFLNSPRLEYLDLSSSALLKRYRTLNPLLDKLSFLLLDAESNLELKYIDLSNSWSIYLNDSQFRDSFGRRGQCLWRSVLDRVFVKLDSNHPCDCTLFYFYRNLINYHFPVMNFSWAEVSLSMFSRVVYRK